MTECDRCNEEKDRLHPLDAVVHPNESGVCDNCINPWDEVVDV